MTTTLSEGVKVPDVGSVNWAGDLEINWNLLNGALANLSGNVKLDRDNIWTGEQSFTLPIVGSITGTASKAIADEDGTSIKTGYVNVAGNQTVSGQKVWTQAQVFQNNVYLANTSYTVGTIPTSNITSTCFFFGASNYQIGYCRSVVYKTTGQTSVELTARNKFTNGALDPNGDYTNATFTVNLDADGTRWIQFANSSIKNGLTPYTTDAYNIGSATNQWLRLFAKFYYYNGTAWGLDQANTWSGYNTFTNYITSQESAAIPAGGYGKGIAFRDYQNNRFGYIQPHLTSDSAKRLLIGVDSGDIASNSNIIPNADNSVNLGSSTNKWSSVYAQTYYYNGTEFQSKFVTTDTIQTINASKTINSAFPYLYIKNPNKEKGVAPSDRQWGRLNFTDKNNATIAGMEHSIYSNGVSQLAISINNLYSNGTLNPSGTLESCAITLELSSSGEKSIVSGANASTDLGTSTNKWKTLNGINPGALSLPSSTYTGTTAIVEIDRTGWVYDGTANSYSPPVDCWLSISNGGSIIVWGVNTAFGMKATDNIAIPLRQGETYNVTLTRSPDFCRIYPCLGNV